MKIAIAGTGYVGLSNAVLLAQRHEVVALDVDPKKVAMLNRRESTIVDAEIEDYLHRKPLDLRATLTRTRHIKVLNSLSLLRPPTMTRIPTPLIQSRLKGWFEIL